MSKISVKRRRFIIKKRQKRHKKLKKLKEQYLAAKTVQERQKLIGKIQKLAPYLKPEIYLAAKNK